MEFTEAFRAEDISKTDFFDFVVTPDDMGGDIVLHNSFPWTRKTGGIFGNNNTSTNNANTNGSVCNGDTSEYRGVKETNNNHLLSTTNAALPSFGDHTFWNTTASSKAAAVAAAAAAVNVKLESPSLEDINDICWPSGTSRGNSQSDDHSSEGTNQRADEKAVDDNTDGSIYTLTVVNPAPVTQPTWYRPPEDDSELSGILKEEEHLREAMSAIGATGEYHTSLDIDSIISILPSLPSMSESLHEHDAFSTDNHPMFSTGTESSNEVLAGDLLGSDKLSQHSTCDDSGFVDSKDEIQNRLKQVRSSSQSSGQDHSRTQRQSQSDPGDSNQPELEDSRQQSSGACSFNENNNDWSFSNNETRHSAESLLRSALQGGKSFLSQYNGCAQHQAHSQDKTLKCLDTHTELQAVQGGHTPPDPASLGIYMTNEVDSPNNMGIIPVAMDSGSVLLFDDSGGGIYSNNQGSSSAQSMDDILLSPLEDYEKFKLIENEVAESAKRYGNLDHPSTLANGIGNNSTLHANRQSNLSSPFPPISSMGVHEPMQQHQTTPAKPKKKSGKKSGEKTSGGATKSKSTSGATSGGSGGANSVTSSNGVRRERSLHHCTICSKAFKDKYSVNVHIRTHTGEKPFACSVCGKSFRQKAHLAKHYHTHVVQKTSEPIGSCKVLPTKTR